MATKERVLLIWFGLAGHSMELDYPRGRAHLSGYDDPTTFQREVDAGRYDGYDIPDGTPVIDKRPALERRPGLAVTMPMLDVTLPPGEHRAFGDRDTLRSMAGPGGLSGAFATLAALAQSSKFTGLDDVATDVYVALWESEGALVGTWENGRISWG